MKGIILASHGKMADGLLDSLELFNGQLSQVQALCLLPGEEIPLFIQRIQKAVSQVDTGDGVVIFCDLLFGSPCNCSSVLIKDTKMANKVDIITGMNLPMVMEFLASRERNISSDEIINVGREGIQDFVDIYRQSKIAKEK
ncbi:PTS sugar transporter subunit IIA [Absicoccus intestinalis]|uniref:PTS sugar transporter subunit IIA n=1 Tax=Absicoccus intestinalis TaxID=2926319 RepID=A0ABU4WIF8_9FIRM|nr:PTS sugar transporter subunit IIA [Absicoccus sp. CLA-KB-P134]MDX8416344.1 PTS sugar transporter subunit IIA [Absicoccus sp. CLA-KB-P134]